MLIEIATHRYEILLKVETGLLENAYFKVLDLKKTRFSSFTHYMFSPGLSQLCVRTHKH